MSGVAAPLSGTAPAFPGRHLCYAGRRQTSAALCALLLMRRSGRQGGGARHLQTPANGFGNGPQRNALFPYRVVSRASRAPFQGETVKHGRVGAVHRGPSVQSTTHIGRDAFLAGDRHHVGGKTLAILIMNLCHAHDRSVDAAGNEFHGNLFRSAGRLAWRSLDIGFRRGSPGYDRQSGGNDEGAG